MTEQDITVLYIIAAAAFLFALCNCLFFMLRRGQTGIAVGTVESITQPNPETAKARNSKWAIVTYKVNGKLCTSENRIQVPMSSHVGSLVTVRYDKAHPEHLYSFSPLRIAAGLCIAVLCFLLARIMQ